MDSLVSINGRNYIATPCNLLVRSIFAEMNQMLGVKTPNSNINRFAVAMNDAIAGAAKHGYGKQAVMDGWTVVVIGETVSIIGRAVTKNFVGQFNAATGEVWAFSAVRLITQSVYDKLIKSLPKLVRAEIDGANESVSAAFEATLMCVHFKLFEKRAERVYFGDETLYWVEFLPFVSGDHEGVLVAWGDKESASELFVPVAKLEDRLESVFRR